MKSRVWNKGHTMLFALLVWALCLSGCSMMGPVADEMNPYGEGNSVQTLGSRDSSAISEGGGASKEAERARHALEVMGTRERAHDPKPAYPVMQPAVVHLMWVPDHLNRYGNLVASHYYFIKVKPDVWKLPDAFEVQQQLETAHGNTSGSGSVSAPQSYGTGGVGSSTPWVYKQEQ